ncbi:MAG: LysR family transcriptional regulator [Lautropia sp.]
MDLRRLKAFMAIAELGSVSQASDRLHIAQTALSRQIQLLEHEIGAELFARHHRGMALTPAGDMLLARIGHLVKQLDEALDDVRNASGSIAGEVALGVTPTISAVLAGRLARRVANDLPDVSFRIVEGYTGHQIDWLQRGQIDIAVVYGPATAYHMQAEELFYERLVLVGPPGSGLRADRPVDFVEAAAHALVLPSQPHGLRNIIEKAAAKAKVALAVRFEADSFHVLLDLVETELGYTILPLSSIPRQVKEGRLRFAPLANPTVMRQIMLGLPSGVMPSPATQRVVSLLKDEIGSMVRERLWDAQLMYPATQSAPRPAETKAAPAGAAACEH